MSFYKHRNGKCINHKWETWIKYLPDQKNGGWYAEKWVQCKDCGAKP